MPASLTLSGGAFSNHASESGARTFNVFLRALGHSVFLERGGAIEDYGGSPA